MRTDVSVWDVTDWSSIRPEDQGKDASKVWIARDGAEDRTDWWLWKPRLHTGDGTQDRLNDVAEVVASRLAEAIGLPAARCEFATRDGAVGAISRMVAPHPYDMTPGAGLVQEHTLSEIEAALQGRTGPPGHETWTAFEVFAGYLTLDAWIANTDRHEQNWAVLETDGAQSWLAPAYDHGSALGSGLTESNRMTRDVHKFCSKGQTRYYGPKHVGLIDLADEAVSACGADHWASRIADVDPRQWRVILDNIVGLSDIARTFINELLTINQERVRSLCRP